MNLSLFSFKRSIASQLFRVIFGLYVLFTLVVASIQMVIEYQRVHAQLSEELALIPDTYSASLGNALWTFNEKSIRSIMAGIYQLPVVTGVKIDDRDTIRGIGGIEADGAAHIEYSGKGISEIVRSGTFSQPISCEFEIKHTDRNGVVISLGKGTIYSSSALIFERVKEGFVLILINSFVKMAVLLIIFIFFVRRILSRPLKELARQTEMITLDNLEPIAIDPLHRNENELTVLQGSFNQMLLKLQQARDDLDFLNENLEIEVAQRTRELELENKQRIAAQRAAEKANDIKSDFISNADRHG
ncbi:hypothetical protein BOW53_16545 [Solemya pervernicosa gill symbiont]|uniref:HAMP domain-containing protein n=2 Tax=Solemya pervernicosa gill symbiont TaxID=642797 RepID=A0A1T2KZ30_9GAMM|nr:hypothetical protein BOW53_16545 [Solemya pervernicosa gill symbiont]